MSSNQKQHAELTPAQERAEEKCFEKVRTVIAFLVATLGASVATFWYCKGVSSDLAQGYDQALLAALIATTIVAGARALEGPDHDPQNRKRSSLPPTSQMARSWLSCFIAVAAVILLAQVIALIDLAPEEPSEAQSGMIVSGTPTVKKGDRSESVEIAGRTEG